MRLAALALCPFLAASAAAAREDAFPPSTAMAEGVSPDALDGLDQLVAGFVDDGEIVGAELLVVVNGRSILHRSYGWRDREAEAPMTDGSVFCVRSMTKPLIGAAIRMLVEDGELRLSDRVGEYLPSFDVEPTRAITIEQLLTHTSGLPMSLIMARDPHSLESLRAVADLGGGHPLDFEPGSDFQYSDQGTDTLAAVIEVVTGAPVEDFLQARVLEPLGMADSTCMMTADHALRPRTCADYAGTPGNWNRFWGPADPPLFGVFLGSQGLYSTVEDYARFLELWTGRGRVGGERLLRPSSVRKTLTPGPHLMDAPSGFPGVRANYGSLMELWTRTPEASGDGAADGAEPEVVAFGHTGSDGTHAWAFPERNAMALYFTQSRGTLTGLRVEERLAELFLGARFDPLQAAPPLEQYLGYYWEGEDDLYRGIVRDGEDLALEILGKAVVPLVYIGEDRWKLRPRPDAVLAFDRSADGAVTGYHVGEHQEFRFEPAADLPSAAEVAARVLATHRLDLLELLGPLRMKGTLTIEGLGLTGETTTWLAWPDRWRSDELVGETRGSVAFDGEHVHYATSNRPATVLEGQPAELLRTGNPLARYGDWNHWYADLRVVQRLRHGDEDAVLVRTGDTSSPAATLYVDWATGAVGRIDSMTYAEGMGRVGQRTSLGDFREVSGMLLPYRAEIELANPMIGTIVVTLDEVEVGAEVPAGWFELAE